MAVRAACQQEGTSIKLYLLDVPIHFVPGHLGGRITCGASVNILRVLIARREGGRREDMLLFHQRVVYLVEDQGDI